MPASLRLREKGKCKVELRLNLGPVPWKFSFRLDDRKFSETAKFEYMIAQTWADEVFPAPAGKEEPDRLWSSMPAG
jgi:hypothetical protein